MEQDRGERSARIQPLTVHPRHLAKEAGPGREFGLGTASDSSVLSEAVPLSSVLLYPIGVVGVLSEAVLSLTSLPALLRSPDGVDVLSEVAFGLTSLPSTSLFARYRG